MPAAGLSVAFVPPGTPGHNPVWTATGATDAGHRACLVGAKAMAAVAYDLLTKPNYLLAVQEEFKRLKEQKA
jgi:aminobenzoyl-glutamate utilization protein B